MDFFKRQDVARKKTALLVFYFVVCVILIIGCVYLAIILFLKYLESRGEDFSFEVSWWNDALFMSTVLLTLFIVFLGTLFKVWQLRKGGVKVASLLGGKQITPDARGPAERRLLNVVEEMAIASGVPVPSVFLLEENGINAFAAGFSPTDCVIGVTRGCMERLNRDELQGVIGHEFSHILNGDMRLNLTLMGILHGILVIALIGQVLMRSRGKKNPLPLLGFLFFIIGYVGVFFGRLIKAALSRQREFLADASAVQFTRQPEGIGGALKKIGGFSAGSRVTNPKAEELSHFYFANGLRKSWIGLLATHPPLAERILAIDPNFDGKFPKGAGIAPVEDVAAGEGNESLVSALQGGKITLDPKEVTQQVGSPQAKHLEFAAGLKASLPKEVVENLRKPQGAMELICALLGAPSSPPLGERIKVRGMMELDPQAKLALVDLALPSLRGLSPEEFVLFRKEVTSLAQADKKIDLFEFALEKILFRHLDPLFEKRKNLAPRYQSLEKLKPQCLILLSCLARHGESDEAKIQQAFEEGWNRLGLPRVQCERLAPMPDCTLEKLSDSLDALALTPPIRRSLVLEASVACIAADRRVSAQEAALVRAVADALDCPLPPFV